MRQLIDASPEVRIAAANALVKTPPELVGHLRASTIEPTCAELIGGQNLEKVTARCERWNHAMYHYVRVIGTLARQSVDPSTALGKWCLPRTQPHASDRIENPACPLISTLRWMVVDPFDQPEFMDLDDLEGGTTLPFEIPATVSATALTTTAHKAYVAALQPAITAATLPTYPQWSVTQGSRSFHVVPICGGSAGFYEQCAFHLIVTDGPRFERTIRMPATSLTGAPDPGTPYVNVRMTHALHVLLEGNLAAVVTDGGSGDDHTRRYDVYDVSGTPTLRCELEVELANVEQAPAPKLPRVDQGRCVL